MSTKALSRDSEVGIWERVIHFEDDLSPAAAKALLKLQFSDADRERMRELAAKARAGSLTRDEEQLSDAYERLGALLDVLHSKSRRALNRRRSHA